MPRRFLNGFGFIFLILKGFECARIKNGYSFFPGITRTCHWEGNRINDEEKGDTGLKKMCAHAEAQLPLLIYNFL